MGCLLEQTVATAVLLAMAVLAVTAATEALHWVWVSQVLMVTAAMVAMAAMAVTAASVPMVMQPLPTAGTVVPAA